MMSIVTALTGHRKHATEQYKFILMQDIMHVLELVFSETLATTELVYPLAQEYSKLT